MAIPAMPPKTADEILDYKLDMSAELAGRSSGTDDAISVVTVTTSNLATGQVSDLTVLSTQFDSTTVTVWLQHGTLGSSYEVAVVMQTSGGRTYHRSFKIAIKDR